MNAAWKKSGIALAVAAVAVGVAVTWRWTDPAGSGAELARWERGAEVSSPELAAGESLPAQVQRTELQPSVDAPDALSSYEVESLDPAGQLASAREQLRSALEASLFGSLDPGAILDAALALGRLEVDPNAYSEPDPSGCTVYPLLGAPDGTRAELWVGRSSKPDVQRVLSLRLELDGSTQPYVLEGCSRSKAIAQLQMQLDHDGRPLNLSILTDLPPSARNRDLGVVLEQGTIPQGVLYCFDAAHPDQWRARTHGLTDGRPGSWEESSLLVAGRWPCPEKLEAFSGLLQSQFETIQH